jgi:SAM-dependent MidA family methyltransferase
VPSAASDDPLGTDAVEAVRAAVVAAGGAIGFDAFLHHALYGPWGFYSRPADDGGGAAGRRGDFITSPEVGPLFGAVVARFLDAEWIRLGRPQPFTVIEAGGGPGTLARSILAADAECAAALRYVAVEVSEVQRARHPSGVESTATFSVEMLGGPVDGVVLANELLDNLPFRLAVFDGAWREAFVTVAPDGSLSELLSAPFEPVPGHLPTHPPHGARAPLQVEAAMWVEQARSLLRTGSVVAIDYVSPTTAALATRPYREWLRTYRRHQRGSHYLSDVGLQDITTEVALDQLPEPSAVRSQAQWLQRWGITDLVDEGKRVWAEQAARPGLDAFRLRSRISEAEALLDPTGLGAFTVLEWHVPAGFS